MKCKNSFPDLCEFNARIETSNCNNEEKLWLVNDLRISSSEIPLGDHECKVSFERLTISVDAIGITVIPGSRFGEPTKQNKVQIKKTQIREQKTRRAGNVRASLTPTPSFGASGEVEGEHSSRDADQIEEDHFHHRVKARPNLRWEITEPYDDVLDGTYMEDVKLFCASFQDRANQNSINAEIKVRQRDLQIDNIVRNESSFNFFNNLTENQKRLIDIFIAKSLSNAIRDDRRYQGEIVLSEYRYDHED